MATSFLFWFLLVPVLVTVAEENREVALGQGYHVWGWLLAKEETG